MKRFFLFSLLLVVVSSSAHAGKVYKWTDENGQVQYSNFPPAEAETEKVRVPGSNKSFKKDSRKKSSSSSQSRKFRTLHKGESISGSDERKKKYEERAKRRAAKNYDRKYGVEARLKRLEQENRQKKANTDRVHRERIQRFEQKKKAEKFKKQMDRFSKKAQGLEGDCKAAHGTDCTNPEYLNKWVRKKYEKKK